LTASIVKVQVFHYQSGLRQALNRKNVLVAADLLNDQVLPFFEQEEIRLLRVLTDRGTEYCGTPEHHEYELYLAIEDIDHSKRRRCWMPFFKERSKLNPLRI
jgi:hypothetical protein